MHSSLTKFEQHITIQFVNIRHLWTQYQHDQQKLFMIIQNIF